MAGRDRWVCFDFDGVLASYDGWKGFDVLGQPNKEAIMVARMFKDRGFKITIFTTRLDTPVLRKWLDDNGVPYDSINSNGHNPPNTSQKPVYHVIIDDRAVRYNGQDAATLMQQVEDVLSKKI